MKAVLLVIGKTDETYLAQGINKYAQRITRYMPFDMEIIPDIKNNKNLSETEQKHKEGEQILKKFRRAITWFYSMKTGNTKAR